jgi:hypothetical protein
VKRLKAERSRIEVGGIGGNRRDREKRKKEFAESSAPSDEDLANDSTE